jgi:extradiol dioxygenase family protein
VPFLSCFVRQKLPRVAGNLATPPNSGYTPAADRALESQRDPLGTIGCMTVLDSPIPRFHLAIPVDDLAAARRFYGEVLGLTQGRSAEKWVDWNLQGHQVVTHLAPPGEKREIRNPVDGHEVPVPHFGLILSVAAFRELAQRLRDADVTFEIEPYVRFEGETGEQWTMFCYDPAGNALEFKAFADDGQVFAVL